MRIFDLVLPWHALVHGRAVDDVSGAPLSPDLTVARHGAPGSLPVGVELKDGGIFCVSGHLPTVFPGETPPALVLDLALAGPGLRPSALTVTVPTPAAAPVDAGDVRMRPLPVRLQGRVTRQSDRTPVPGAVVTLVDDPHPPAPPTAHVLALRQPLARAHLDGAEAQPLTPVGPDRHLAAAAKPADQAVQLDDATGLAAGDLLLFDSPDAAPVAAVVAAATPAVQLTGPLGVALPGGALARALRPGAAAHLAGATDAGDGLVLVDTALAAAAVAIDAGDVEVRYVGALTDAQGYYHLDGVGRVTTVFAAAAAPPLNAAPVAATLAYSRRINVLDLEAS
jgi:hypothetical protein